MKGLTWKDLSVVGVLAAVVGAVLPLQTYLGNADIYPFSFLRLLPELLLASAVLALGLLLVERILSLVRLRPWASPLLAALSVCAYLESGVLSMGLPELNGGIVRELSDGGRAVFDLSVWAAVVVGFVACARWVKPFAHWISLAVLVLMAASLADVRKTAVRSPARPSGSASLSSGFESQPTVVANVKYSPTRNILIFILDSMPGADVTDSVLKDPALQAKFAGFTAYPNNVGMHECTKRGVPGLVTGLHYDPEVMSEGEYPMTMYGTNSFVTAAVRAGWNVAFSPDLLPYGFTNLPVEKRVAREEKRRSRDALAFLRQSREVPHLSLFDVVAFRLSPFVAKGPILYSRIRHAVKGRHSSDGFWGERSQYAQLAERPVGTEARPFLGVFHTWGAHPPWKGGLAAAATGVFGSLGELMEAYRAKGIYDRALIIVTADHGLDAAKPVGGFPPSASALLWVKPEGAAAPLSKRPLQTSHARIAPFVRASIDGSAAVSPSEALLRDNDPLYRAEVREGGREFFKDWRVK